MGRKSRLKVNRTDEPPAVVHPVPGAGGQAPNRSSLALPVILILILIAAVFGQVAGHDFVNYDDPLFVSENLHVRQGLTLDSIRWSMTALDPNWHPLTWLTLLLDVQLFGVRAGVHALINVLFHAIASVVLLLVLVRATGYLWRSAIVAMLFAIHPLHVESVAWISERKDVVSTLFFVLTLLFYVAYAQRKARRDWILALGMFILGLLSKGMLVTLPFVLLLMDYWPLRRVELLDDRRSRDAGPDVEPVTLVDRRRGRRRRVEVNVPAPLDRLRHGPRLRRHCHRRRHILGHRHTNAQAIADDLDGPLLRRVTVDLRMPRIEARACLGKHRRREWNFAEPIQ